MEQEEDTLTMPPFWLPNGDGNHHQRRRLRRSYSLLLTSTSLLVLLLIITLVFGLIVVPTLHSFASNIFRPHTVKNSWDSLNLVLVLFAIVCGFLSKTNTSENQHQEPLRNPETPPPYWYEYNHSENRSFNRLRSFNSHPDLRRYSSWIADDEPCRFYDDTSLLLRHRKQRPDAEEGEEEEEKVVSVEKVVTVASAEVDNSPPQQPELQSLPDLSPSSLPERRTKGVRRNVKRTYQAETIEKPERDDVVGKISQPPPLQQPEPQPMRPPSPSPLPHSRRKSRRNDKRTYQVERVEKPEGNDVFVEISQPPLPPQQQEPQPLPPSPSPLLQTLTKTRNVKRTYQVNTIEKPEGNQIPQPPQQQEPKPSPPSRSASTSQPPATHMKGVRRNVKQTYHAETIEKAERNDMVVKTSQPPPPPPPPPIPAERKTMQGKKKRGIATKEFLTSWRGKKKKQRQRSVENFQAILNSEPLPVASQPPLPLPSPPPPPSSVFHDLFSSKKSKSKKHHIVSVATVKPQPRLPNKREHSYNSSLEDNVRNINTGIGNESPLIPIPPPPPPPPFKLPAWKFRVKGDFVRIDSIGSSRSGSPDDEAVDSPTSQQEETSQCNSPYSEDPSSATASASAGAASLFCPSPDVDTKAHNFIESFRAGLRMARLNSMKEKQGIGRSNLGPSPNP